MIGIDFGTTNSCAAFDDPFGAVVPVSARPVNTPPYDADRGDSCHSRSSAKDVELSTGRSDYRRRGAGGGASSPTSRRIDRSRELQAADQRSSSSRAPLRQTGSVNRGMDLRRRMSGYPSTSG